MKLRDCFGLALLLFLSGCAEVPTRGVHEASALPSDQLPARDLRAAFRADFCELLTQQDIEDCDSELWRFADEPASGGPAASFDPHSVHVFIVDGAFAACFGEASRSWTQAVATLRAQGVLVTVVPVVSRASARYNASAIAVAVSGSLADRRRKIIVGYSKGGVDALHFLVGYPQLATSIDALVNVAVPIQGSLLADRYVGTYDALFGTAFAQQCEPGDSGVVSSLTTAAQQAMLKSADLPGHVRLYSVVGLPDQSRLSPMVRPGWEMLSRIDRANDGVVQMSESYLPEAALLGLVNADHFSIALDVEEQFGPIGRVSSEHRFPDDALLESIVRVVSDDLSR